MSFAAEQGDPPGPTHFSVGGTIALAFRILGRAPGQLIALLILQIVLTAIVVFAVDLLFILLHVNSPVLLRILNYLLEQVGVALATGAIVTVAFAAVEDRPCSLGDALAASGHRFGPMLGVCILQALAVGIGMLLLIVPGLIVVVVLAVAVPACMLEGLGPLASFSRSAALTRGRRWAIFGLFLLFGLASFLGMGLMLPLFWKTDVLTIALAVLGALGVIAIIVVATTLSTALYVALRPAGVAGPQEAGR